MFAEILYADGHFAHALEAYQRVRRSMDPESGLGQVLGDLCMTREKRAYKLGCCHLALGCLEPAEAQFREGLDADANHGGCHYGLARVALLRDDRAGAIEQLEATLKNDPAWKTPRELLTKLRAEGARTAPIRRGAPADKPSLSGWRTG